MKSLVLLLFSLVVSGVGFAQKIDKNLPDSYKGIITQKEYERILVLSVNYLKSQNISIVKVEDGGIFTSDTEQEGTFYLDNLVRKCKAASDEKVWEEIVNSHFEAVIHRSDGLEAINLQDYETAKKYLSIRIYPPDFFESAGGKGQFITREDIPGTVSVIMIDLPTAFMVLMRDSSLKWGKSDEMLFQEAIRNLSVQSLEEYTRDLGDSIMITALTNDDYAASCILDSVRMKKYPGKYGATVSIPSKGAVLIHRMDDPVSFVQFINITHEMVNKFNTTQQGPITTDYFWYYKGKWTKINVAYEKKAVNVFAPLGLVEMLIEKE